MSELFVFFTESAVMSYSYNRIVSTRLSYIIGSVASTCTIHCNYINSMYIQQLFAFSSDTGQGKKRGVSERNKTYSSWILEKQALLYQQNILIEKHALWLNRYFIMTDIYIYIYIYTSNNVDIIIKMLLFYDRYYMLSVYHTLMFCKNGF